MAIVVVIESVEDHPNADRLSVNKFNPGITVVSNKLDNGSHRYSVGDLMVYFAPGETLPEDLLKQGYWDEEKGKGYLGGDLGNVVGLRKMRGIESMGIIMPANILVGKNVNQALGVYRYDAQILEPVASI